MSRVRTVVVTEIFLVLGLLAFVGIVYVIERGLALDTALRLSPLAALAMSAVPALLWLAYFYVQDRHEPEPTHYVLGVYVLGCLVAGPVANFMIAQLTGPPGLVARSMGPLSAERLVHTFLIVALTQELCKYAVVRYTVYRSPEFDEPMDGIVYMTAAGIGFATWDNYQDLKVLEGNVFLTMGAARTVVTTLAHACFAGATGYALSWAKFSSRSSSRRAVVLFVGLLVAAALSGQFRLVESLVTAAGMDVRPWRGLAFAAGFAAVVFFATSLLMRRLLDVSPYRPGADAGDAGRRATSLGMDDGPPSAWQRHDVLVVIGALALLAAGRLAYHSQATPRMLEHAHQGLRLERPGGWLPVKSVADAPPPLAAGLAEVHEATLGRDPGAVAPGAVHHVVYTSPADAATRVEVRIAARPPYGNLAGAIAFLRRIRYGELYRSSGTEVVSIAGRDWLRTRFRYAHKLDKQASPRVVTGIELATAGPARIYSVTVHGEETSARRLAELIAPTLALDQGAGEPMSRPVPTVARDDATSSAMQATVMIVAADLIDGRLEPVSGGSGVIVSAGGAVLTNAHIVVANSGERLHDLFVIGRWRAPDRAPELLCAGFPEQGEIDLLEDLALLRCTMDMSARPWTPRNWPMIAMGRSDTLIPGEPVRVLGYPDTGGGGLRMVAGELTGWSGVNGQSGRDYVKTDADIAPGTSGGAVINEHGALIGIATAYRVRAQLEPVAVERIGLIRPIDRATHLLSRAELTSSALAARASTTQATTSGTSTPRAATAQTLDEPRSAPPPARSGSAGVIVTSKVVDAANDRPIAGAMVIVFAPGIDARELDLLQLEDQALAWGQTDEDGEFWLQEPLSRGQRYTVAVLAEEYQPLTGDGALILGDETPDFFDPWGVIRLARK